MDETKAACLGAPTAQSLPPGPEVREDRENPKPGETVCLNKELCSQDADSSGGGSTSAASLSGAVVVTAVQMSELFLSVVMAAVAGQQLQWLQQLQQWCYPSAQQLGPPDCSLTHILPCALVNDGTASFSIHGIFPAETILVMWVVLNRQH